uniref:Arf-GAP with Rho-GAP domain, ANK repeat and PH domain-containing protein 3-like n=1 Tax=Sinocyclocheilus rhinocerous TaxID=307959 RepID=A0A673MXU7_9TELE
MATTIGPCSDAEDLLASIHLERYLDHFRQAGFLLARDFCHVDNVALNRVGVTATGHRKRILKLVEHIQLICQHQRKEPSLDRCNSDSAIHEVTPVKAEPHSPSRHPMPPRLNRGIPPSTFRKMSDQERLSTPPDSPSSYQCSPFTNMLGSPPSPPCSGLEMVSNEIYCGTLPGTPRVFWSRSVPVPPPRQEVSPSTENHSNITVQFIFLTSSSHRQHNHSWLKRLDSPGYCTVGEPSPASHSFSLPHILGSIEADEDHIISPYASFTSLSERAAPILSGWLDKLSPQGNYVFQKRYVKFDGKNLMYYGSEKDAYPKGVIPLAAIQMARVAKDNKFEVVTSHRTFVFRADNDVQRCKWCNTLQERVKEQLVFGRPRFGPGSHCQKSGFLELKTKSKIYTAIIMEQIWLYKSEQCFKNGIGITVIEARGATIRDGKGKSFDLITPYKTFSFTAESEREKRDWMEALQESIAETLSDYEVAEKIWSNRSNKICADCKAINSDWASINLCVVICKNCAGQHRGLGTMVSKVQSLKLDTSVWSNEIVQLFIMLGNDRANEFWAARLPVTEELDCDASPEQRREFITHKYREGRYRHPHPSFSTQEELLKVKVKPFTPTEERSCKPMVTYSCVYDEIMQPILYSGYLYKSSSLNKGTLSRRTRDGRRLCALNKQTSDRCHEPSLKIDVKDIICLGVSRPDSSNNSGFIDKFRYTFELYLTSDKLIQFGLETLDALHSWARAIGKATTPLSCHCLLAREFERVGVLRYKAMLDPQQWKEGFFVLQKSNLPINLSSKYNDSVCRTLHLQGMGRTDFSLWYTDIQKAAGGKGNTLKDQQLSRNDIPIIVDSCIAFITQYGLGHEGIYRKNGAKSRIKLLMEEFRKDARNVKLRIGDNFIEDVTDVLKRFFREIDDPIFMADLHPFWREAAKIPQKPQRLDRYKELIRGLPRVNRTTLAALISHLYRVQKCADLNQMCTKNLSLLFAPSLFQTDGKGEHEVKIIEDLIDNFLYIFDIDEEHQTQIELEISLITTWRDTQLSQAGDLIIEVYLEEKIPDCCITLKVSPTMCAEELTNQVLYMRNIPAGEKDVWMTFEAIEEGELERPLHPKEKVLEQALQWCKMANPSSAYLVVKKVPRGEEKRERPRPHLLKCREEPPKLLQGNKFQERSFQIKDHRLLLMKDKKSNKPEKEWQLKTLKIYMGIRKKLKPPTKWGLTVMLDKQQLYLSCSCETELWDWMTNLLKAQNDDLRPPVMRRHSSSDISKQKFGTMPLVPIRGEESNTNSTMLSANQTLVQHYGPMKVQQDSFEERIESPEPLYEEVGDFGLQVLKSLETSFLSSAHAETQEVPARESLDTLGHEDSLHVPGRHRSHRSCSPQQELLLQELSTMFCKKPESEEQHENLT